MTGCQPAFARISPDASPSFSFRRRRCCHAITPLSSPPDIIASFAIAFAIAAATHYFADITLSWLSELSSPPLFDTPMPLFFRFFHAIDAPAPLAKRLRALRMLPAAPAPLAFQLMLSAADFHIIAPY